jgi:hypothetical protein
LEGVCHAVVLLNRNFNNRIINPTAILTVTWPILAWLPSLRAVVWDLYDGTQSLHTVCSQNPDAGSAHSVPGTHCALSQGCVGGIHFN